MTTKEITPQQRLTVLKHLANGRTLELTATATRLTRDEVLDIGNHHGYPHTDKLAWAVDVLTKKIEDDEAAAAISTSPESPSGVKLVDPVRRPPAPTPARPTPPAPTAPASTDSTAALLLEAAESPNKNIQRLGRRISDLIIDLDERLDAEKAKATAKAKKDREKAAARAEVDRLEQQLAAAKQRLRPAAKRAREQAVKDGTPRPTKPAGEYPCTVDGCGRKFTTGQGASLHERRAHGDLTGDPRNRGAA
jgi:hypothetical protein